MHHEENQGIWVPVSDEPTSYRDAAAHKVGKGKEGAEQCVFLVLDDIGAEHDVLVVCSLLDCVCGGSFGRLLDVLIIPRIERSLVLFSRRRSLEVSISIDLCFSDTYQREFLPA